MNTLKFLKSTLLVALMAFSFTSCSSDDSEDVNNENKGEPRMTLKIDGVDYEEWVFGSVHSLYWEKRKVSENSFVYVISGLMHRTDGTGTVGQINFDLGSSIKVNQIIEVTNMSTANNYFSVNLSVGSKVFDSYEVTSGQLKITHFDGKTISGEFTVNNMQLASFTPEFINVTKGVFKNIPVETEL